MKTTMDILKAHNLKIALGFINDDVPVYCSGFINPLDEVFNEPIKKNINNKE